MKIDDWLTCEDYCERIGSITPLTGRDSVRPLHSSGAAISILEGALEGLEAPDRENLRRQFAQAYGMVDDSAVSQEDYVAFFLDNYEARYQTRAAISLNDFVDSGSVAAFQALERALKADSVGDRSYRPEVRRTIERLLLTGPTGSGMGFLGGVSRAAPFLGRVTVLEPPPSDFDGDESVFLYGAPFPDDLTIESWPDSLAFLAVGEAGVYALSVVDEQTGAILLVDSLTVTSFAYTPRSASTTVDLGSGPFPRREYLALRDGARDDYFRFQPGTAAELTAIADWSDSSDVAVIVNECSAFTASSNEIVITVLDGEGDPLPGVGVRIGAAIQGVTDARGHFASALGPAPPPTVEVRLEMAGSPVASREVAVGSAEAVFTLLTGGQLAPEFSHPDTARADVPAGDCWMIRVHRLAGEPEPAIARLRVETLVPNDHDPPVFGTLDPAPAGSAGVDVSTFRMQIGGTITDDNRITSAELTLFVDGDEAHGSGADGTCDPSSDYLLDVAVGDVDRNGIQLANGSNSIDFSGAAAEVFEIMKPGGGVTVTYCFILTAEDDARDVSGSPSPNVSPPLITRVDVTWNP